MRMQNLRLMNIQSCKKVIFTLECVNIFTVLSAFNYSHGELEMGLFDRDILHECGHDF